MKKIITTILSLFTLLSLGSMSAFAVLEENNECTKSVSKRQISEETKNKIKAEFTRLKDQSPDLNNRKIYEIISRNFNVSISSVKRCNLPSEGYENYKEYCKNYYKKNKDKYYEYNRRYREKNKKKLREYSKQYDKKKREIAKQEKEEWNKKLNEIINLKRFSVDL